MMDVSLVVVDNVKLPGDRLVLSITTTNQNFTHVVPAAVALLISR